VNMGANRLSRPVKKPPIHLKINMGDPLQNLKTGGGVFPATEQKGGAT